MLTPVTIESPRTAGDDRRIGHLIGSGDGEPAAVIVGFPSDKGVVLNGGRAGAAGGPDAIRKAFYAMAPGSAGYQAHNWFERVHDLGNISVTGDVAADQAMLAAVLQPYLAKDILCVVIGGGHEASFGHYLGYVACDMAPRILNWDAHPDVRRPLDGSPTSGSSFYMALTHDTHPTPSYTVAGLLPHAVADAHVNFLHDHDCDHLWKADVSTPSIDEIYAADKGRTMVSFDLDAVDAAFAPGVSAPAAGGLDPPTWFHAAYGAGLCASVSSIDVCELNPLFDIDGRTARIAALTVWQFMSGCATRFGIQRFIRSK